MGKVITVWGSPGSGKSMFCCILAKALTRDKRKAIIINADMNVPIEKASPSMLSDFNFTVVAGCSQGENAFYPLG